MLEASGAVFFMGNKKKNVQSNQVAWSPPPRTQATTNLQSMVDTPTDYATSIRSQYARAERDLDRSYNNPFGAYSTADVREKSKRAQKFDLQQNLGADLGNAAQQSGADKFNRQATVAQLTQPRMYGSQSTNVDKTTGWDWLGLGVSTATSALT